MPIHDVSYRHWKGESATLSPTLVLAKTQLRLVLRRRAVRVLLLLSGLWVVAYLAILYRETMPRDGALGVLQNLPLLHVDGQSLKIFLERQRLLHYLLCLAAGAEVIALDRRYKALQIYLARPLRVSDYLLGKALPLVVLLSLTTWIPALFLLLLKSTATASLVWLREEPHLPFAILGYSLALIASLTTVTLAVSSLSSSPRLASAQLVAVLLLSLAMANVLAGLTRSDTWRLVSLEDSLDQLLSWLFRAGLPYDISPWAVLGALLVVCAGCAALLRQRVHAVDVVGG